MSRESNNVSHASIAAPPPGDNRGFDQFYTKPETARACWRSLLPVARKLTGEAAGGLFFIEPSAGEGVFYNLLPADRRAGIDIDPKCAGIMRRDFLKCRYKAPIARERVVVVGNPPFGKRGKLAVDFVNKAFTLADTVAFIVPVIFKKYFIHKQIEPGARLVSATRLDRFAFRTATKPDYPVNTEFQIWTRLPGYADMRKTAPPEITHPDFVMYQYNNTREALKLFANSFDFAVPCQGWQDYTRREHKAEDCEKHKQWMLFKANCATAYKRLFSELDFADLSMKYTTTTPGFRKGDVVQEYRDCYD